MKTITKEDVIVEPTDKLVWLVRRNKDGQYLCSVGWPRWGSLKQAHIWKVKGFAMNQAEDRKATAIPFALVEVDPDSIPRHVPKPIKNNPELEKMLESKI